MLGTWDSYGTISIHALLAESDGSFCPADSCGWHFYPRSPCGERRSEGTTATSAGIFLSTLSLRRATLAMAGYTKAEIISIHALLAESDYTAIVCAPPTLNFYPRSPCGERPIMVGAGTMILPFLSTLSLRRATTGFDSGTMVPAISIHALLAESDPTMPCTDLRGPRFLSTLSLRRATAALSGGTLSDVDFYPRSPCGERHGGRFLPKRGHRFLSTLSLRRATVLVCPPSVQPDYFYPRSPCGERPTVDCNLSRRLNFYPRSPCGERLTDVSYLSIDNSISIHALLAESDTKGTAERRYIKYFYPRSPCGERLLTRTTPTSYGAFLSTLSLRRATLPSIATYQGA